MRLDDLNGRVIAGRFELKEMIGKGGYGAVFEARQLSVDRRCAVKVLLPGRADDHCVEERFRAEARATSRLTHPHTLVLYDFGVDEETGFLFLVTEFLDGQTLDELLDLEQTLAPHRAVRILEQIAHSLQDAHAQDLIHRDVKPKNIMLVERAGQRDFVKVIDFGIAKALTGAGEDEGLTQTGTLVGTPQYMAPEQLLGAEVDARSDQYALAVVGYRMLTGRNPFAAATPMETALRHINERALPLRTYCPELRVGQDFEDALLKALEKAPRHRYGSTVEMVEALRDALGEVSDAELQDPSESGQRTTEDWPQLSAQVASAHTRVLDAVDTGQEPTAATRQIGPVENDDTGLSPANSADDVQKFEESEGARRTEPTSELDEAMVVEVSAHELALATPDAMSSVPAVADIVPTVIKAEGGGDDTAVIRGAELAESQTGPATRRRPAATPRSRPTAFAVLAAMAALVSLVVITGFVSRNGGASQAALIEASAAGEREGDAETRSAWEEALERGDQDIARALQGAYRQASHRAAHQGALVQGSSTLSLATHVAEAIEQATPRTGTLQVTLIPWGTLYVGRRAHGEATRQRLELPAGRHELSLRQHGQTRVRQTIDVVAGAHRMIVLEAPF